jgi:hypothetical protein
MRYAIRLKAPAMDFVKAPPPSKPAIKYWIVKKATAERIQYSHQGNNAAFLAMEYLLRAIDSFLDFYIGLAIIAFAENQWLSNTLGHLTSK